MNVIEIVGGCLLLIGSMISTMDRHPRWSRIALGLSGVMALLSGSLFFVLFYFKSGLSTYKLSHLLWVKASFGGVTAGILITLYIAGELRFNYNKSKNPIG